MTPSIFHVSSIYLRSMKIPNREFSHQPYKATSVVTSHGQLDHFTCICRWNMCGCGYVCHMMQARTKPRLVMMSNLNQKHHHTTTVTCVCLVYNTQTQSLSDPGWQSLQASNTWRQLNVMPSTITLEFMFECIHPWKFQTRLDGRPCWPRLFFATQMENTQMENTKRKHTDGKDREKTQRENTDSKHRENTERKHRQKTQRENTTTTSKTPTVLLRTTKYWILLQFWAPSPQEVTKGSLGNIKSLHFTTILNVQHARNHERVAMVSRRIRVLPQFWASDTSEVTKGLLGPIQNLHFTTVLDVRHVQSDEMVARPRKKFAFYHSFERPTCPKWRKGRSATWKICVLPQFWASDTSEVTKGSLRYVKNLRFTTVLSVRHARSDERVVKSTGAIPAPRQKKNIF